MSKITGLVGVLYLGVGPVFPGINIIENQAITDPYFVEKFNAGMLS